MGFVSKMVKLFEKRLDFEEIPNLLNYINMIQKKMSEGLYLAHYPFTFDQWPIPPCPSDLSLFFFLESVSYPCSLLILSGLHDLLSHP